MTQSDNKSNNMKAIKHILFLCVALCFATSCKKDVDLTLMQKTVLEDVDFRYLAVDDAWQVTVVADSVTYVELEYSAYLEPYLKTKLDGLRLEIGFTGNVRPVINSEFRATVHANSIDEINAHDASQLVFSGHFASTSDCVTVHLEDASVCTGLDYSGNEFLVIVEDASQFLGFHLNGTMSEVKMSDASTCKGDFDMNSELYIIMNDASRLVTFGGAVPYVDIKLQDACLLNMVQTDVNRMGVRLSGASEATVNALEQLDGGLTEASTLYYKGHPQLNVDCSDDSQLIPF